MKFNLCFYSLFTEVIYSVGSGLLGHKRRRHFFSSTHKINSSCLSCWKGGSVHGEQSKHCAFSTSQRVLGFVPIWSSLNMCFSIAMLTVFAFSLICELSSQMLTSFYHLHVCQCCKPGRDPVFLMTYKI